MSSSAVDNNNKKRKLEQQECPYLDTINRDLLDFDMEARCSVSLEKGPHIYACLVCGKFFRGRGSSTPAYTHAVSEHHYVYVHLTEGDFYCLPDGYRIAGDSTLADIKASLQPSFTPTSIQQLEQSLLARDWFGRRYLPGFVGLNNLSKTDGINALLQALAHVKALRNHVLLLDTTAIDQQQTPLARAFCQAVRRMWSSKRLKHSMDPQVLVQQIVASSNSNMSVQQRTEMTQLVPWFLNQLHAGLSMKGKKKKHKRSSIITDLFSGKVQVTTTKVMEKTRVDEDRSKVDDRLGSDDEPDIEMKEETPNTTVAETKTITTSFMQLTLDIPETPLFKDAEGELVIPQEPLINIIQAKFGPTHQDKYRIQTLPKHLILLLSRFSTNQYRREKNPTILPFPIRNFDLSSLLEGLPNSADVDSMSISQLKDVIRQYDPSAPIDTVVEKQHLKDMALRALEFKYSLVSNICFASEDKNDSSSSTSKNDPLNTGAYKTFCQSHSGQWFDLQDLHVSETLPQQVSLSESHVLMLERQ